MHGENPRGLVENRVVAGLARSFREQLGRELCGRCEFICYGNTGSKWNGVPHRGVIGDGGFRIKSLVEAGADLSLKGCSGGNTALMMVRLLYFTRSSSLAMNIVHSYLSTISLYMYLYYINQNQCVTDIIQLIQAGKLDLIHLFLLHDVPVTITNDDGQTPLNLAQYILSKTPPASIMPWHDLLSQITKLHQTQTQKIQAQESARTRANAHHRQRERHLSATNQNNINDNAAHQQQQPVVDQEVLRRGLGTLEANGQGYFPSLFALQFQGSVPEPSASFRDLEVREKRRLDWLLKGIGIFVLAYFLIA